MKFTFDVPESAQRAARRALALHKESPLPDTGGMSVAEVLATGTATLDVVGKVHRFFQVNSRVFEAEAQAMHTEHDSPLVRSWLLYGAEAGRRWAESIHKRAVSEGYQPTDPVTDLFTRQPDEIYAAFSVGAWRFEYDLDPRKAARFVEEYHRATGWNLDLRRAFGDSAPAVSTALYRRFHPVDPFKEAARCLTTEDVEYQLAAQVDLAELTHSVDALEEGLKPGVYVASATITAKMVWPAFVAYVILASERPDLLVAMNKASQKPPLLDQKPKTYTAYHDAINTFVAFFHPNGSRFVDPMKASEESAKAFGSLPEEMSDLMTRAYYGKHISPVAAQKLLGKARRWTAENKFAGSLFHVFNADWKKGNWQHILDNIPEDADVRPYFQEFVKENPMPAAGVKLQQTLSDKALKAQVASYLAGINQIEDSSVDFLDAVKIDDTQTGEAFQKLGTPLGVYSVIGQQSIAYDVLGAFKTHGGVHFVLRLSGSGSDLTVRYDSQLAVSVTKGETKIILAHKDMPGSAYSGKKPVAPKPAAGDDDDENIAAQADPKKQTPSLVSQNPLLPDLQTYLIKNGYADAVSLQHVEEINLGDTYFAKAAKTKFGKTVRKKQEWVSLSVSGKHGLYTVLGAYKWDTTTRIILKAAVGKSYYVATDDGVFDAVGKGTLVLASAYSSSGPQNPDVPSEPGAPTKLSKDVGFMLDAAQKLATTFSTTPVDWNTLPIGETSWSSHADDVFQTKPVLDQFWVRDGWKLRVVGALRNTKWGQYIVFESVSGSSVETIADTEAVKLTKAKVLQPFGWKEADKTPLVQQPTSATVQPEGDPFAYHVNDVIEWDGRNWLILSVPKNPTPSSFYAALELVFTDGQPHSFPTILLKSTLDKTAKFVANTGGSPLPLAKHFRMPPGITGLSSNDASKLGEIGSTPLGGTFIQSGAEWTVLGYHKLDGKVYVFAAAPTSESVMHVDGSVASWSFLFDTVNLSPVVKSSYAPPAMTPELPHEDDEPDPEQGSPLMSGTQAAFDFLKKKGWKPATSAESPLFKFPLGGRQFYGAEKSRTIIGYGFGATESPVYVHVTEEQNIGWVECLNAHKKYGPLDAMVQPVVDALLPKPGEKPAAFPKLNYKLSKKAKQIAQEKGTIFVPAPKGALYYVNTPLTNAADDKIVLIGWVGVTGDAEPLATLHHEDGTDPLNTFTVKKSALNEQFSLRYENGTAFVADKGDIVFGKKPGQETISLALGVPTPTTFIPSDPTDNWDSVPLIHQPPVPEVTPGKHASAGIIAIVPAGSSVTTTGGMHKLPVACVVLYHPLGSYGGYKLCIPKGTVDKGESMLKTAVREFHEETGLTAKPVAFLGDFRGNQSLTRLYIGYVTGGNPYKKKQPEECDAVTFKPLTDIGFGGYSDEKWYDQLVPASGNKWQQAAIDAAVKWLLKNGMPETYQPETETEDAAVSIADDVSKALGVPKDLLGIPDPFGGMAAGLAKLSAAAKDAGKAIVTASQALGQIAHALPASWSPSVPPSEIDAHDPWKALLFKVDFPITSAMVDMLRAKAKALGVTPVSFDCARNRPNGPKYGEAFETSAGTPFIASGYVAWKGDDGALYPYLLVTSGAGSVDALQAVPDGLAQYKISSDQSLAAGPQDAWYEHPDAATNAAIQAIYQKGTVDGSGVNMKTFKESWMKTAGVPAYAVITANMVRDVASMFVPGACPQVRRDAILLCLKSRMKATHSGKKGKDTPVGTSFGAPAAPPPTPIVAPPAPSTTVLPTGPLSPILKQYVDNPQPHLFGATGKKVPGGSKPNMLLNGPGGKQWFAKYAPGEDWRARIDRAAYQLSELCKPNNVPVGVMSFDGKLVSYQPFAPDAKPVPAAPTDLDEQNMAELLAQHAVDMFMGDHDGHAGNWISVAGRIIAVDRGQAFKFILQGKPESLDPNWHAPGNFGDGYAKRLLIEWSKGSVEIPEVAWASMLKAIRGVAKITDTQLQSVLTPVFQDLGIDGVKAANVVKQLAERRDSYEKDWTTTLKKLRKSFVWPKIGAVSAPTKVFTSSPKDVGFGKPQEKVIADAVAAKWQGKALQLAGTTFENQEVMVRRVLWEEKPGLKVPATLIHFRVSRPAGIKAATKLYGGSNLEIAETLGGPQRLKADHKGGYWEKIYAAVKTLNFHLFKQKDTAVNENTIAQMTGLRPILEGLVKTAADPSGVYAPTNEPNEAVYAMAEQYLQYLGIVEYWVAKKEELVGQHSPTLVEFLWEPPVPEHAVAKDAPPYKVSLKKQGALWPTAVPVGQEVHVTNLNKPVMNSASQSQFVIEDPLTKARVFWNPPGGLSGQGLENVKDGVESLKGQGWAIVPGEPSAATVAHLLKLFAAATGLDVKAADEQDAEVLYWSKQAAALQGGGIVKPKPDHTAVVEPGYAKALAAYEKGNAAQAIEELKLFVATKLDRTVAEVSKLAKPDDVAGKYTRGAGFFRHERIGWTRERLMQVMGKGCRLAHHLSDTPTAWMQAMANNGALLSNAIKAFYGVTKTGASPGQDMNVGGGQGLFLCFRKGISSSSGMIYFDISLALRLDVYIVGKGDTYGGTNVERYTTPEQWVAMGANTDTGTCGASSGKQVNIRHDIDIREYLVAVSCGSASARAECIKIANSLGWTFYGGAKPEDVFRAS